jgi:hypothetical protein
MAWWQVLDPRQRSSALLRADTLIIGDAWWWHRVHSIDALSAPEADQR